MSSRGSTATEVEIFGALYHVRGDKDPEYLRELADEVDQKMREIAQQVSTVDTGKIAILVALNLTDELFQCRKHQDGDRGEIEEKVQELAGKLGKALQG
jgi:cell division protein ZapA